MKFRAAVLLLFCLAASTEGADFAPAPANGFRLVDLSPLADSSEALARQFSALPTGLQNFHGVPFRIGSIVAVTGMESARKGIFFPTEISFKIAGQAKRIHLLHGTMFADKDGVPVAKLVFHYADGSEEAVRLGYGVHVRDWIAPRLEKASELLDPNSQLAWSDVDEWHGTASRIFQTAIDNPKPGQAIASIDLVSMFSRATPFVLAITIEGAESALAVNRPLPARKALRDLREFPDSVYRGEISVQITDAASGAPPKDAVVSLGVTDDKETFFFGETKPDAQGVCRMTYPRLHSVGLRIWVHAPERAPFIISESRTNVSKFAEKYSVALQPGVAVGGVVKDASANAVAGAQVFIHQITRISPHHYGRVDYDAVLTATDGKWTSHSLPEDLSGFSFQVTHPDYRPALFLTAGYAPPPTNSSTESTIRTSPSVTYRVVDGRRVPMTTRGGPAPGARTTPLLMTNALLAGNAEMILQPALLLEGTLLDATGNAVPSAEVIVQRSSGERKYLRTDGMGRFQSRAGEPGETAVIVLRDGFAPVFRGVNLGPGTGPLEIRLGSPHVLRGRVQDRSQRPVSGARVRLDDWNGTSDLLRFQTLTDADGTFIWTGAPPDRLMFYVSKTNFASARNSFSGSGDNMVIQLNRSPGVYGKVYDAETKAPVESFTVVPGRKYSPGEDMIHWDRSESGRGAHGEYSLRMSSYYFQSEGRVLVEAPGYQPQISRALNGIDSYACDFALERGKGIAGLVLLPNGSPAAGAALLLVERGMSGSLSLAGQLRGSSGSDLTRSDAQGHFEFAPKLEPEKIFVSHEQGFAEAKVPDVGRSGKINLEKWGRVKGVMRVGEKGETDASVQLQGTSEPSAQSNGRFTGLFFSLKVDPDSAGAFEFEKVPPGEHRLAVEYRFKDDRDGNPALSHGFPVIVKPGEAVEATLGGTGRRVTGRVKILGGDQSDMDWKRDVHRLILMLPEDAAPPLANAPAKGFLQEALTLFGGVNVSASQSRSIEAMRARQRAERTYVLVFDTNGVFHADNVPPGKYTLSLNVSDPEDEYYNRRTIGSLNKETVVPDEPNTALNAPLDLGTLELTIQPRLKPGMTVPVFEAKTSDGRTVKLADFRGRPILLHFWGLSMGWSSYDFQVLKEFQRDYGAAGKLAIIGYNLDRDASGAEQFVRSQGLTWTQTYLGDWRQTPVSPMFGLNGNGSACVLIDPEGKVASGQLRGTALRTALSEALSAE